MIDVVVLTYNAEKYIIKLLEQIKGQTIPLNLIVIDSSSTDNTQEILRKELVPYIQISSDEFNHGGTRNKALEYSKNDFILYLTQDALPFQSDCFEKLVKCFNYDESIGLVYGRQLPYPNTSVFESFPRLFNYGEKSILKNKSDIPKLGLKTSFCSNSFAAYRKDHLLKMGGFPTNVIFGEDACVSSKMVLNNLSIYYCAEAQVYHSHKYSFIEEFRRYFDIGTFHTHQKWILDAFTSPTGEGFKYVKSEFIYLIEKKAFLLIPSFFLRNGIKFLGYQLGKRENKIPTIIKRKLSMSPKFWMKKFV